MTIPLVSSKNYTFITIDNSHLIEFPVYLLDSEPQVIDGLVFYDGKPIDDRNINYPTLGGRRLQTPHKMRKLKRLCFDFIHFLQKAKSTIVWGIDNSGTIIKYRKTRFERLICHRIKEIVPMETHSVLLLDGINFPIEIPRPVSASYAQILYYKSYPWRLYSICDEEVPLTKKKV